MVLLSARNLNDPGSNPLPGVFKINLVFFSLLQKKYQSLKNSKSPVRFLYLVTSEAKRSAILF